MFKNAVGIALFCLHVIPLNSLAVTSADIDALISQSHQQAEATIQQKIADNQVLISEISALQAQIEALKGSSEENRRDMRRGLYIAAGTALATSIAVALLIRPNPSEVGGPLNMLFGAGALLAGSAATVTSLSVSGINYMLVRLDESKIPGLQSRLAELKTQLENQNLELGKK